MQAIQIGMTLAAAWSLDTSMVTGYVIDPEHLWAMVTSVPVCAKDHVQVPAPTPARGHVGVHGLWCHQRPHDYLGLLCTYDLLHTFLILSVPSFLYLYNEGIVAVRTVLVQQGFYNKDPK